MNPLSTYEPNAMPMPASGVMRQGNEAADDKSLFQILWRRRRIVALATALPLVLGLLYLLIARPTYTAAASLFIEPAGGKKAGQEPADRAAFLYTQRQVITSTPVLSEALGQPGILDFETFAKQRDVITAFRNALSVEVGTKDDLVSVSLDSPYPNEATQLVASVVKAYTRFQTTQRTVLTSETLTTLAAEKAGIDKEVAERSKSLQAFSIEHRIVGPETDASSDNDVLRAISASLTQAHLNTIAATSRLAAMPTPAGANTAASVPDASFSVEDDAAVRQQLLAAATNLDALSTKYPAGFPALVAAKARVEQLKRQRYAVLESIRRAAVKQESDLQAYYDTEQRSHIEQRAYAAEYARMNGERQRLQERADAIDTRLRDLKVNDEGKMADVSVLEPAHVDTIPSGPKKSRVLGLALVAGLALGVLSALAWDQFDSRFESVAEVDRWLGLAPLGVLPGLPSSGSPTGRALFGYSEPNSAFAHACRGVATAVIALGGAKPFKTVAIASPSSGDGRTTIACGLAIAMSQQGRRVLLVDADVTSPRLATLIGVGSGPGLAELIEAPVVDAALVRRCVRETLVPNLSLLTGGRIASLDGANLGAVLDTAAGEYDVVIVDTPCAHKSQAARVVAANCQATLLVVRFQHTDCFAAARVRNDLFNVGANVLGVLLNQPHGNTRTTTVSVTSAPSVAMPGAREPLGLHRDEQAAAAGTNGLSVSA